MCSISVDSRDPVPLTPGHFLVGRPLRSLPPTTDENSTTKNYAERWTLILAMRNSFWATWKKEVLHQLIQTNKWRFPQRNLEVGDVVILHEENTPPSYWPLGRIVSVQTNRSGLVRVVTVKTANSILVRPIHKLIYLPLDDQTTQTYTTLLEPVLGMTCWSDLGF